MAEAVKRTSRKKGAREVLRSMDPRTGALLHEYPANTPEEVRRAVVAARRAAPRWAALPVRARAEALAQVRATIHDRMDHVVDTVSRENGKPPAEALAHDVVPTLVTMAYLEQLAPLALRPRAVGKLIAPLLGSASRIEWRPYGVVGCISPWNYP